MEASLRHHGRERKDTLSQLSGVREGPLRRWPAFKMWRTIRSWTGREEKLGGKGQRQESGCYCLSGQLRCQSQAQTWNQVNTIFVSEKNISSRNLGQNHPHKEQTKLLLSSGFLLEYLLTGTLCTKCPFLWFLFPPSPSSSFSRTGKSRSWVALASLIFILLFPGFPRDWESRSLSPKNNVDSFCQSECRIWGRSHQVSTWRNRNCLGLVWGLDDIQFQSQILNLTLGNLSAWSSSNQILRLFLTST